MVQLTRRQALAGATAGLSLLEGASLLERDPGEVDGSDPPAAARQPEGVAPLTGREVQVLDSFGLEGKKDECGGLSGLRAPTVNMCFPPLVWQTYDVDYRTGKVDPETKKPGPPTITVVHNGVKVHDSVELKGGASQGGLHLQNHGNPVVYRNIWVVEMK